MFFTILILICFCRHLSDLFILPLSKFIKATLLHFQNDDFILYWVIVLNFIEVKIAICFEASYDV